MPCKAFFVSRDVTTWGEITCIECVQVFVGGRVRGEKYLVSSF